MHRRVSAPERKPVNTRSSFNLDLYVITDSRLAGSFGNYRTIEEAIAGGASVVQLREKDYSTRKMIELGLQLRELTRRTNTILIVNDRVDVALAVEADGVHVGQDDMPAPLVRKLVGPKMIIGVSATTYEEAIQAKADGADYLGVGPVFPTGTKLDAAPVTGIKLLGRIKRDTGLPVVAIGGINRANTRQIIAAGGDGISVISAIVGQTDPRAASAELYRLVTEAKGAR